jgi:hypothetical protein
MICGEGETIIYKERWQDCVCYKSLKLYFGSIYPTGQGAPNTETHTPCPLLICSPYVLYTGIRGTLMIPICRTMCLMNPAFEKYLEKVSELVDIKNKVIGVLDSRGHYAALHI